MACPLGIDSGAYKAEVLQIDIAADGGICLYKETIVLVHVNSHFRQPHLCLSLNSHALDKFSFS